jgi:hypothetical protein
LDSAGGGEKIIAKREKTGETRREEEVQLKRKI